MMMGTPFVEVDLHLVVEFDEHHVGSVSALRRVRDGGGAPEVRAAGPRVPVMRRRAEQGRESEDRHAASHDGAGPASSVGAPGAVSGDEGAVGADPEAALQRFFVAYAQVGLHEGEGLRARERGHVVDALAAASALAFAPSAFHRRPRRLTRARGVEVEPRQAPLSSDGAHVSQRPHQVLPLSLQPTQASDLAVDPIQILGQSRLASLERLPLVPIRHGSMIAGDG